MHRLPRPEPLSPRALARLRTSRATRSGRPHLDVSGDVVAYVPSVRELGSGGSGPAAGEPQEGEPQEGGPPMPSVRRRAARHEAGDEGGRRPPARWFRLPTAFLGARWEPSGRAVLGVALAVGVAVLLFALRVGWASTEETVIAPGGGSRAGPSALASGSVPFGADAGATTGAGVPSSSPAPSPGASGVGGGVVVHVVGQVRRPGLQRLPPGSRVADAVEAAGGATTRADLARVNLARVLVDGEQVVVPAPGDPDPPGAPTPGAGGGSSAGSSPGGSSASGKVSLNTADLAGLDALPGVGPVLAQRILDWRSEHGRFTSVDELGEVSGIGEKVLDRLRPLVTL